MTKSNYLKQRNTNPTEKIAAPQWLRWTGYIMFGWSLLFSVLHFAWAAGWPILTGERPQTQPGSLAWLLCAVILSLIGALTGLAVIQSRINVLPRRLVQASILSGSALVFFYVVWSYWINGAGWILAAGVLCVVGAVVALALTQPWGQQIPRWLPLLYAWVGGAILTLHALYGIVVHGLVLANVITWSQVQQLAGTPVTAMPDEAIRDLIMTNMLIWNPWFLLGGMLYLIVAWNNSRHVTGKAWFRFALPLISLVFIFAACTPVQPATSQPGLANTQWKLVSFGAAQAEKPVITGSTITLKFNEKGQVEGSGGCNSYSGPYTVQDSKLVFGEITSTLMACADQAVTDQEAQYLQALRATDRYTITDNTLSIRYDNDRSVLNFVRETASAATPMLPTQASSSTQAPGTTQVSTVQVPGITDASLMPSGPDQKQYVLPAKSGQTIVVDITSDAVPLSLIITSPNGAQRFPEMSQGEGGFRISHKFVSTETGDYHLTLTKADHTPSTNYTVNLTVQ